MLLTLTIAFLWLLENKRIAGVRLWLIFLGGAIAARLYSGVLTPISLPAIALLGGSAWVLGRTETPSWFKLVQVLSCLGTDFSEHRIGSALGAGV